MKIVDLKTFLTLPENTVFCKIPELYLIEDINIKHANRGDKDWFYWSLNNVEWGDAEEFINRMDDMVKNGASYPLSDLEDSVDHDGLYDENPLFLIYEKEDIQAIIDKLTKCLEVA